MTRVEGWSDDADDARVGTFQAPFPPAVASGLLLSPLPAAMESPGMTLWR